LIAKDELQFPENSFFFSVDTKNKVKGMLQCFSMQDVMNKCFSPKSRKKKIGSNL